MKLEIYQSSTIFNSSKLMLQKIDYSDITIDNIVVVPDKFSLLTEKILLDIAKEGCLFNVKVKSLSALSSELLQRLGQGKCDVISSGESLLLTQLAIENVKKDFVYFKRSNINFCYEINKLISQLKSSCVTGDDLAEGAVGLTGHKFHDVALVYNEYQQLLKGKLDANERLKLLKTSLENSDLLAKTRLYFSNFDAFTKEAFEFINVLCEKADKIAVALARPLCVGNEYIYEKDLQTKFLKLAENVGAQIDVIDDEVEMGLCQKAIIKGLYSYEKIDEKNNGYYNLYGGGTLNAEVESVAKLIRFYAYKGNRYRDFQIAVCDLNRYSQIIEDVFEKYEIPFYVDSAISADQTILGNFVLAMLSCVVSGYSQDCLIDFFANPLVDEGDLIADCQHFSVDGRAKYKQHIHERNPFKECFESLEGEGCCHEFSTAVKSALLLIEEKYESLLQKLQDDGHLKTYKINLQMADVLNECLALINEYSVERMDCGEFLNKLKLLLSFKQVSTVPTYLDSVMIGDAAQSGFEEKPFLVVLGGEELPIVSSDTGLLADEELNLAGINKEIEPTIRMVNRRNRFKLFNLLTLASKRLFVFYQIANSEGKRNELPAYVKSLNGIFKQSPLNVKGVFFNSNADSEDWALLASDMQDEGRDFGFLSRRVLIHDGGNLLFAGDKIKVTQLENYFVCPFKHFASHGLKLKEAQSQFDQRDLGNACHKMAELYVKDYLSHDRVWKDGKKFVEKNIDYVLQIEGIIDKIQYLDEKNSLVGFLKKQMIFLLNNIVEENSKSKFLPKYIEVNFDNLKIGKYSLIGKADRIDEFDEYLRVLDYKTGNTVGLLKGLYYGEKLQLFLYQKVASEKFGKKPGGAFYFNAKFNYSKDDGDEYILKGLTEDNAKLICALDENLEIAGRSDVLQIRKDSKGFKGAAVSPIELDTLCKYAYNVGEKAVQEIEEGHISPMPSADACQWCPYGALCGYECQNGVRQNKDEPDFN